MLEALISVPEVGHESVKMAKDSKRSRLDVRCTESCGNLFADLGLPDAEGRLAEARIATQIF